MPHLFSRKPIAELVPEGEHGLRRVLGAGDLVMLAIGAVIGAGIFGAIGTAAAGQVDANGAVEVDLLCADARVAVELDGAQHLADADAYRRDRRKDQLLQENGYLVLRFLADDVGKDLDRVLDCDPEGARPAVVM